MSFDLILQSFDKGREGVGKKSEALEFLSRFSCTQPDEFGFFTVSNSIGFEIEIGAKGLLDIEHEFSGAQFHLHGLSSETISFIYDFAEASGFVIFNPQAGDGGPVVLLPETVNKENLPCDESFLELVQAEVHSDIELGILLREGMAKWQDYRKQVISGK
ncbi:MAG: hypothetical protein L3J67_01060 [Hyphomicrobiaceae bacterium]|nr:hypothetical protein [Hyphomicrobiaceae bacterium]